MSNGNSNEVQKLVALRHGYKDEAALLEADLKAKFEQALVNAKKDLKDKYLEKLVDWFYSNGFEGTGQAEPAPPVPAPEPVTEPAPPEPAPEPEKGDQGPAEADDGSTPALSTPVCNDCGTALQPDAKFCDQCAAPVETETETNTPTAAVAPAGRMTAPRTRPAFVPAAPQVAVQRTPPQTGNRRGYQAPEDKRFNDWSKTHRR